MKPDLFRLLKHGSILMWKVVAILGGAVVARFRSDTDGVDAEPSDDVYPWDASRADEAKYLDDATAAGIAWNYYGSSQADKTDWDFTS